MREKGSQLVLTYQLLIVVPINYHILFFVQKDAKPMGKVEEKVVCVLQLKLGFVNKELFTFFWRNN